MRSIVEVIDKILAKLPDDNDQSVANIRNKITQIQNQCKYKAPELVVEDQHWSDLSSAILYYKDKYWNKMWYCEVVATLSNRSYDEIVRSLATDMGAD